MLSSIVSKIHKEEDNVVCGYKSSIVTRRRTAVSQKTTTAPNMSKVSAPLSHDAPSSFSSSSPFISSNNKDKDNNTLSKASPKTGATATTSTKKISSPPHKKCHSVKFSQIRTPAYKLAELAHRNVARQQVNYYKAMTPAYTPGMMGGTPASARRTPAYRATPAYSPALTGSGMYGGVHSKRSVMYSPNYNQTHRHDINASSPSYSAVNGFSPLYSPQQASVAAVAGMPILLSPTSPKYTPTSPKYNPASQSEYSSYDNYH